MFGADSPPLWQVCVWGGGREGGNRHRAITAWPAQLLQVWQCGCSVPLLGVLMQ